MFVTRVQTKPAKRYLEKKSDIVREKAIIILKSGIHTLLYGVSRIQKEDKFNKEQTIGKEY